MSRDPNKWPHDTDLRKAAAGRVCQVRLFEIGCTCREDDCVLAHLQYPAGIRGGGQKAPDLLATLACSICHDEIDRRTRKLPVDIARTAAYEGCIRTIRIWIDGGIVRW